jgi:hypothetical protein
LIFSAISLDLLVVYAASLWFQSVHHFSLEVVKTGTKMFRAPGDKLYHALLRGPLKFKSATLKFEAFFSD